MIGKPIMKKPAKPKKAAAQQPIRTVRFASTLFKAPNVSWNKRLSPDPVCCLAVFTFAIFCVLLLAALPSRTDSYDRQPWVATDRIQRHTLHHQTFTEHQTIPAKDFSGTGVLPG
jgi:hypothetical protein